MCIGDQGPDDSMSSSRQRAPGETLASRVKRLCDCSPGGSGIITIHHVIDASAYDDKEGPLISLGISGGVRWCRSTCRTYPRKQVGITLKPPPWMSVVPIWPTWAVRRGL